MAYAPIDVGLEIKGLSDLQKLERRMEALEKEVTRLQQTTPKAANSIRKLGSSARGASGGVGVLSKSVQGLATTIAPILVAVAGLTAGFKTLSDQNFFEAKVRSLGVDSEVLVASLKKVSAELKGQASVAELTGAAYDVASAGFNNAADASKVLKAATLGAVGGFSDINTVANATTSVLNAYGLSADKAGALVDGFIQTQNDGKIVIGEYARNIGKLAPIAAALGVPLEDINGSIAAITANGLNAEIGITALRSSLAKLGANSKEATELLAKYGVTINATTIGQEGLLKTFQKLSKVTDKTDLLKIVGTEAGQAIAPLLNDLPKLERLILNQANAAGVAQKANDEAAETIRGAWTSVTTAFSNVFSEQSAAAEALIPVLQGLADTINAINSPAGIMAVKIGLVTAAVIALNKAIVVLKATALAGWISRAIPIIAAGKGALLAKAVAAGTLNKALLLVRGTMAGMPWALAATAIGIIAVKTYEAVAAQKSFEEALKSVDAQIVKMKIKELEEQLVGLEKKAKNAAAGLSTLGGEMGVAALEAAVLRTRIAELKGELDGLPQNYTVGGITYDWKTGQAINPPEVKPPAVSTGVVDLGGSGGGAGAAGPDRLKLGSDLLEQQQRDIELLGTASQLEKDLLKIEHDRLDVIKEIAEIDPSMQGQATENANNIAASESGKAIGDALAEDLQKTIAIKKAQEDALRPLQEQRRLLEGQLVGKGQRVAQEIEIERIMRSTVGLEEAEVRALVEGNAERQKQVDQMQEMKELAGSISDTLENGLVNALGTAVEGLVTGAEDLDDQLKKILQGVLKDIANQMIKAGISSLFKSIGGGGGGGIFAGLFGGGKATGGPVTGGTSYLVGEKGPEIFTPGATGQITNNENTKAALANYSGGNASAAGAMAPMSANVTYSGPTLNFNGDDYIPRSEAPALVAAGAKQGQARAMNTLKNSRSQRQKLGM